MEEVEHYKELLTANSDIFQEILNEYGKTLDWFIREYLTYNASGERMYDYNFEVVNTITGEEEHVPYNPASLNGTLSINEVIEIIQSAFGSHIDTTGDMQLNSRGKYYIGKYTVYAS